MVLDEVRKLLDVCRVARGSEQCINLKVGVLRGGHVALVRRSLEADDDAATS